MLAFDVIGSKTREMQATLLFALEMRNVAPGNTVNLSPKLRHQGSFAPYWTDKISIELVVNKQIRY